MPHVSLRKEKVKNMPQMCCKKKNTYRCKAKQVEETSRTISGQCNAKSLVPNLYSMEYLVIYPLHTSEAQWLHHDDLLGGV